MSKQTTPTPPITDAAVAPITETTPTAVAPVTRESLLDAYKTAVDAERNTEFGSKEFDAARIESMKLMQKLRSFDAAENAKIVAVQIEEKKLFTEKCREILQNALNAGLNADDVQKMNLRIESVLTRTVAAGKSGTPSTPKESATPSNGVQTDAAKLRVIFDQYGEDFAAAITAGLDAGYERKKITDAQWHWKKSHGYPTTK